jgi:hypothetical protein
LATASSLDDEYTAAKSSSYLQGLRMLRNSAPDGAPVDELEQLLTRDAKSIAASQMQNIPNWKI